VDGSAKSTLHDAAGAFSSPEVQKTVDRTWREFVCGMLRNRTARRDAGDPLICDGLQHGITSHSYRTTRATDQVRFLYVKNYRRWIDDVAAGPSDDTSGGRTRSRGALVVVLLLLLLLPPLLRAASARPCRSSDC